MYRYFFALFFQIFLLNTAICQDPRRFQTEIDQFKADKTDYTASRDLILFTGSSTIRIWTDIAADFPKYHVLNRGFGGSHMSDLLFYADTVIMQCRPAMIFIYEGDNDIGSGKKPKEIMDSADKLLSRIRAKLPKVPVVFISAKPSIARWSLKDTFLEYNGELKRFASQHKQVYYLEFWDIMLDAEGKPRADLFQADGLHMNRSGYDLWKPVTGDFIRKHKARAKS